MIVSRPRKHAHMTLEDLYNLLLTHNSEPGNKRLTTPLGTLTLNQLRLTATRCAHLDDNTNLEQHLLKEPCRDTN